MNKKHKRNYFALFFASVFAVCGGLSLLEKDNSKFVKAAGTNNAVSIAVNRYDQYGNVESTLKPCDTSCVFPTEYGGIIDIFKANINSIDSSFYPYYKCEISLLGDCLIPDINTTVFEIEVVINLNGYTLTLSYEDSWKIYGGLTINGSGTINIAKPTEYKYSPMSLGAIWVREGELNVKDVTFNNCATDNTYPIFNIAAMDGLTTPRTASFSSCHFNNCSSTFYGGAISITQLKYLNISNCTFENCSSYFGGAICVHSYCNECDNYGLFILNSTFENCSAENGGAIYARCYKANLSHSYFQYINNTKFIKCTARNNGGACVFKGDHIYWFCTSSFNNCSAGNNGGAICIIGNNSTVNDSTIDSCSATRGGGVYFSGEYNSFSNSKVNNCIASEQGGAYFSDNTRTLYLSQNEFSNNKPSAGAGTFLASGSAVILLSIVAAIFLTTTILFAVLYLKKRKENLSK